MNFENLIMSGLLRTQGLSKCGALILHTDCSCHRGLRGGYSFSPRNSKSIAKAVANEAKKQQTTKVIMVGGCPEYEPDYCISPFKVALAKLGIESAWLAYGKLNVPGYPEARTEVAINNVLFPTHPAFAIDLTATWPEIQLQEAIGSHLLRSAKRQLKISEQIEDERKLLAEYPRVFPVVNVFRVNSYPNQQMFVVDYAETSKMKFTALFSIDWEVGILLGKEQNFKFFLKDREKQIAEKIPDIFSYPPKELDFQIFVEDSQNPVWLRIKSGKRTVEKHHTLDFLSDPDEHFIPLHQRISLAKKVNVD